MKYISTRGQAENLGFCDAVLAGLATDGGLYLPEIWPELTPEQISGMANSSYEEVAFAVISEFVGGEIEDKVLKEMIAKAYHTFRHPSVTPLVELEPGHFVLELFHGPTLAFKDVAMQLLARIMDHILGERGKRATIIGATSGDTGSAAIEAFRGRSNTDIFILHPHGRVTDVQRRQMTTVLDDNVHNISIDGSFDDCQHLVKSMFLDTRFRDDMGLSGVNSINWGRIVAQIVYYFTSAIALGAPHRKVSFTVPTGNFGDIFAGYAAKRMGLPIDKLVIATNSNDILRRALETGHYQTGRVTATSSPSMDIQVSSNFERLLFEAYGRDPDKVRTMMNSLAQSGGFEITADALKEISRDFLVGTSDEKTTGATISHHHNAAQYLLDPHTATGVAVAEQNRSKTSPMITLATAHPAKFPDAVKAAAGVEPALPAWLGDLHKRTEKCDRLANDLELVQNYIRDRITPA
ncbi:MAG TPA: threonine synthase [Devosia sp.]|nr:threonine synthase [Devosia sp.]